jgi:membrane-associated protease RseP (regulator of RpoE activity)
MNLADLLVFLLLGSMAGYANLWVKRPLRTKLLLGSILLFCPIVFTLWTLIAAQPIPKLLMLVVFLICAWLYFGLTHQGQQNPLDKSLSIAQHAKIPASFDRNEIIDHAPFGSNPILTKQEETELKTCFPLSVFYLQAIAYQPETVICRGMLRISDRNSSAKAYEIVAENLRKTFGDRFFLCLYEHPIAPEASPDTRYAFAIAPNPADISQASSIARQIDAEEKLKRRFSLILAVVLAIATAFTTLYAGALFATNSDHIDLTFSTLLAGVPYSLAVGFQIAFREIARYVVAKHYQLRLHPTFTFPTFGGLGMLGTFTRISSYVPNRRALFNLAIAPNWVGFGIAVVMLTVGLYLSPVIDSLSINAQSVVSSNANTNLILSQPFEFKRSMLVASIAWLMGGGAAISNLHPLAAAGWTGLLVTAVSLIPIGVLDGGNLIQSIFGDRKATLVGQVSRLFLLSAALLVQPWLRIYALLAFLFDTHKSPTLDNVSELNNWQDVIGLMLIGVSILIMMPVPKFLLLPLNLR